MKIGVLGGGQLARMMVLRGAEIGFEVHVLSENKNDPAAQITRNWHAGSVSDSVTLQRFFANVDAVTFESEFIETQKLIQFLPEKERSKIIPSLAAIERLKDRHYQKAALVENQIPTASYCSELNKERLSSFFKKQKKIVIKKRTNGYDGYGTFIIKRNNELTSFIAANENNLSHFIAEELLPFKKELALTAIRDKNGHTLWTPLVEWKARDKKCWWVKGPVKNLKIEKLKKNLNKLLKSLNYIGCISFEIFDCGKSLYVNELAPRVHNSAHYTLNSLSIDQFQAHLIAVGGLSLKTWGANNATLKATCKGYAMVNLIGRARPTPIHLNKQLSLIIPQIATHGYLHWYDKSEEKPGRKMGHINVCSEKSPDVALKIALKLEKEFMNGLKI